MGKILLEVETQQFAYLLHQISEDRYEIVTEEGDWVTKTSLEGYKILIETDIDIPRECPDEGFDSLIIRQSVQRIDQARALFTSLDDQAM